MYYAATTTNPKISRPIYKDGTVGGYMTSIVSTKWLKGNKIFNEQNSFYFKCMFVCFVCLMVLNATFTNISVISCWSVLLVEETGEPGENHRPVASH